MSHPPTQEPTDVSPGYYTTVKDTSTQTTDADFFLLKQTQEASTQTTDADFFLLEQTQEASTQTTDEDLILPEMTQDESTQISKGDLTVLETKTYRENNSAATSENSKKNRKRNVCDKTSDRETHKLARSEICRVSEEIVSTFNEQGKTPDSRIDASKTISQIEKDNSCLTGIYPELRNIEESHAENQGVEVPDDLENKNMVIAVRNTPSNINISQNENAPDKVSDSKESKGKIALSVDILAVPGPSRPHEDIPKSESCQENPQAMSRLILQTVAEMKRTSMCFHCSKEIAKHLKVHEEKNKFKCCVYECKYRNGEEERFLSHICNGHLILSEPYFCNICRVRFSEVGSHESEHPCNVCEKKFQCIPQLEDHYLVHENYYKKFCRICKGEIDKHVTKRKEGIVYVCCRSDCQKDSSHKSILLQHLYIHSTLKIFKCQYCGERFKSLGCRRLHYNKHPECKICWIRFLDGNSLDAHRLEKH